MLPVKPRHPHVAVTKFEKSPEKSGLIIPDSSHTGLAVCVIESFDEIKTELPYPLGSKVVVDVDALRKSMKIRANETYYIINESDIFGLFVGDE